MTIYVVIGICQVLVLLAAIFIGYRFGQIAGRQDISGEIKLYRSYTTTPRVEDIIRIVDSFTEEKKA